MIYSPFLQLRVIHRAPRLFVVMLLPSAVRRMPYAKYYIRLSAGADRGMMASRLAAGGGDAP
jgi:hypothetical protein